VRAAGRTHRCRGPPALRPDVRYGRVGLCGNRSNNRVPHHFGRSDDGAGHDLVLISRMPPSYNRSTGHPRTVPSYTATCPRALAPDDADGSVRAHGLHRSRSTPTFGHVIGFVIHGEGGELAARRTTEDPPSREGAPSVPSRVATAADSAGLADVSVRASVTGALVPIGDDAGVSYPVHQAAAVGASLR
jgi:hypothetical protein